MATQDRTVISIENLALELRRGVLAVAVLAQCGEPQYGYSLKQHLAEHGLDVNEGTLYPLLRRLEEQGLLDSEWRIADESRPRRYYRINAEGKAALAALIVDWRSIEASLDRLLTDLHS